MSKCVYVGVNYSNNIVREKILELVGKLRNCAVNSTPRKGRQKAGVVSGRYLYFLLTAFVILDRAGWARCLYLSVFF